MLLTKPLCTASVEASEALRLQREQEERRRSVEGERRRREEEERRMREEVEWRRREEEEWRRREEVEERRREERRREERAEALRQQKQEQEAELHRMLTSRSSSLLLQEHVSHTSLLRRMLSSIRPYCTAC
jgi:hypothetical protein